MLLWSTSTTLIFKAQVAKTHTIVCFIPSPPKSLLFHLLTEPLFFHLRPSCPLSPFCFQSCSLRPMRWEGMGVSQLLLYNRASQNSVAFIIFLCHDSASWWFRLVLAGDSSDFSWAPLYIYGELPGRRWASLIGLEWSQLQRFISFPHVSHQPVDKPRLFTAERKKRH